MGMDGRPRASITWPSMAANGKGNGKTAGGAAAPPSAGASHTNGAGSNGKARDPGTEPLDEVTLATGADPGSRSTPKAPPDTAEAAEAPAAEPPEATPASGASHAAVAIPAGAAWARPLVRFEERWTWLESRMLTVVLVWQILALVAWVFLNGLSESVTSTAGTVFRAVILAIALGLGVWFGARKQPEDPRRNLTLTAIAAAIGLVVLWHRAAAGAAEHHVSTSAALSLDHATSGYFDNIKGWLQDGSTLTLLGGLRGLGTRLTLWLALLGGSLATAAGKHIHIDVVFRFLPKRMRVPVSLLNYFAAALVCLGAVWGFFDHIAIESYGSRADDAAGKKIGNALHVMGNHAFLTRKQIGLDLRSLPHVLGGERYDQWMTAARWNAWVDEAGFEDRYEAAKVAAMRIPADAGTHPPFVVSPDGEVTRGALAHTLGLVFPVGLFAIALRFLIRALLTLSGHYSPDPDEAHKEEIGAGDGPANVKGAA